MELSRQRPWLKMVFSDSVYTWLPFGLFLWLNFFLLLFQYLNMHYKFTNNIQIYRKKAKNKTKNRLSYNNITPPVHPLSLKDYDAQRIGLGHMIISCQGDNLYLSLPNRNLRFFWKHWNYCQSSHIMLIFTFTLVFGHPTRICLHALMLKKQLFFSYSTFLLHIFSPSVWNAPL